jgi:hypothetical protein
MKRVKGITSFPKSMRDVLARCVQSLDTGLTEDQILESFGQWSAEDFWRDYDTAHKIRSFFAYVKNREAPRKSSPPAAAGRQEDPPTAPTTSFPEQWNQAVPERQVDPSYFRNGHAPEVFADPSFGREFAKVCERARAVIGAGGGITFSGLLKRDRDSQLYGWQRLLAGEYDWMIQRHKPTSGGDTEPTGDPYARLRERREERQRAKAQSGNTGSRGDARPPGMDAEIPPHP